MWVPVEKFVPDLFPFSFHVVMTTKAKPYTIALAHILCMYVSDMSQDICTSH